MSGDASSLRDVCGGVTWCEEVCPHPQLVSPQEDGEQLQGAPGTEGQQDLGEGEGGGGGWEDLGGVEHKVPVKGEGV